LCTSAWLAPALAPPGWPRGSVGFRSSVRGAPNRPTGAQAPAPPGQARWGRRRGETRPSCAEASTPPGQARWGHKPSLHRGQPGGGTSLRSTGASPVGAEKERPALLVQKPPLHRGEPGGDTSLRSTGASPVGAEKGGDPPFWCRSLHSTGTSPLGAEVPAPPGPARWGRRRRGPPFLCRSLHATGASPVGAVQPAQSGIARAGVAGRDRPRPGSAGHFPQRWIGPPRSSHYLRGEPLWKR